MDGTKVKYDLPNELWQKVFEFLPEQDRQTVAIVSNRFDEIIYMIPEDTVLTITEENLEEIKADIVNQHGEFKFNRVDVKDVTSIDEIKFIFQSIGSQINELSMENTRALPEMVGRLRNLKSLTLNFNTLKEEDCKNFNLRSFSLLEKITFINNKSWGLETQSLLTPMRCPDTIFVLKYLELDCPKPFCELLADVLSYQTRTLETLHITFINVNTFSVDNCIFKVLSRMENLMDLSLKNIHVGSLMFVKGMHSLQHLELINCNSDTDTSLLEINNLRSLKISNCASELLFRVINIKNYANIIELELSNIDNFDTINMHILSLLNLRTLQIGNLKNVSNDTLAAIFCSLPLLRNLTVFGTENITNEGFIGFGKNPYSIKRLRYLRHLQFDHCCHLTDRILIDALILPNLGLLDLCKCHRITSVGIRSLVKNCPLLDYLGISSNVIMNNSSLFHISNGLKHLKTLSVDESSENDFDHIKIVFNKLEDPFTKKPFSSKCKLVKRM